MAICCVVASESLLTYDPVRSGGIPRSALHLTIPEQACHAGLQSSRLLKKLQMQGRREEETGAYWVVRENAVCAWRSNFRRPRIRTAPKEWLETDLPTDREATQQMDFFSSLLGGSHNHV
jgi:hypothetical protein